jgi:hypothetical protein
MLTPKLGAPQFGTQRAEVISDARIEQGIGWNAQRMTVVFGIADIAHTSRQLQPVELPFEKLVPAPERGLMCRRFHRTPADFGGPQAAGDLRIEIGVGSN